MSPSNISDNEVYNSLQANFGYPKSKHLRKLIETVYSPDEARLCLSLPGTADEVAKKVDQDVADISSQLDKMASVGSISRTVDSEGNFFYSPVYMPEVFCDSIMHSMAPDWDDEAHQLKTEKNRKIADLFHDFFENDWYRFERTDELLHRRVLMLGGKNALVSFTVTPAWKALEKCKADPPPEPGYDLRYIAQTAKEEGKKIYAAPCSCKVRGRKEKMPVWTCGSMTGKDRIPASWTHHPNQIYKEWDPDEWLEMMGQCEEEFGLVHIGLPPMLYDICTCDTECCNIFYPLRTYAHCYEGLDKSPYQCVVNVEACQGLAHCIERCRFEAIKIKKDPESKKPKAVVNPDRCSGCGQCVLGCTVDGALKLELRK